MHDCSLQTVYATTYQRCAKANQEHWKRSTRSFEHAICKLRLSWHQRMSALDLTSRGVQCDLTEVSSADDEVVRTSSRGDGPELLNRWGAQGSLAERSGPPSSHFADISSRGGECDNRK